MSIDLRWIVPKNNQLWLKWSKINHIGNGIIDLKKPRLYGPVLSDCLPLEESGKILLDLTKHFIILIPEPYEVTLEWNKKLSQSTTEIKFDTMKLIDTKLGLLNILKNKDLILIDCTDHTTERISKGFYKFSFNSMIYQDGKEPYNLTYK